MMSDRNLVDRRNVKVDVHKAYRANRDFMILEVTARVLAATMSLFKISSLESQPQSLELPSELSSQSRFHKQALLHKISAKVVDEFILQKADSDSLIDNIFTAQEKQDLIDQQQVTEDGRYPCRFIGCQKSFKHDGKRRRDHEMSHDPPPIIPDVKMTKEQPDTVLVKKDKDDMYNYNTALLNEGLLFMNYLDAVAEGDGDRIIRQYKYLMLICKADGHSKNYALECLHLLFQVFALLTPRDAHRLIWNRGVNNHNTTGTNIALDIEVEMSNLHLKQAIKNLGVNVTENAVLRICKAEKSCRQLLSNVDKEIKRKSRSKAHSHKSPTMDLKDIVMGLVREDVFTIHENRKYRNFPDFDRDPTSSIDMSDLFYWINKHKKNIDLAKKAR